jgi:hypothetical protein
VSDQETNGGGFGSEAVPEADQGFGTDWDDLIPEKGAIPEPEKPQRKKLTRSRAKAYQDRKRKGFWFTLQHTRDEDNEPMVALVHRVNFLDKDTLGHLPKAIANKLLSMNVERARRRSEGPPQINEKTLLREMGKSREMSDAYVCAGFVEPRVYMTEAEADLMGGVWVEDIDVADRMVFLAVCEGSWEDALTVLTPFLDETDGPVEAGEAEPPVPGPTPVPDDLPAEDDPIPPLVLVQ